MKTQRRNRVLLSWLLVLLFSLTFAQAQPEGDGLEATNDDTPGNNNIFNQDASTAIATGINAALLDIPGAEIPHGNNLTKPINNTIPWNNNSNIPSMTIGNNNSSIEIQYGNNTTTSVVLPNETTTTTENTGSSIVNNDNLTTTNNETTTIVNANNNTTTTNETNGTSSVTSPPANNETTSLNATTTPPQHLNETTGQPIQVNATNSSSSSSSSSSSMNNNNTTASSHGDDNQMNDTLPSRNTTTSASTSNNNNEKEEVSNILNNNNNNNRNGTTVRIEVTFNVASAQLIDDSVTEEQVSLPFQQYVIDVVSELATNQSSSPSVDRTSNEEPQAERRQLYLRQQPRVRKLQVRLLQDSIFVNYLNPCPPFTTTLASCQTFQGQYILQVTEEEDPIYIKEHYTNQTKFGITYGTLSNLLDELYPESELIIVTQEQQLIAQIAESSSSNPTDPPLSSSSENGNAEEEKQHAPGNDKEDSSTPPQEPPNKTMGSVKEENKDESSPDDTPKSLFEKLWFQILLGVGILAIIILNCILWRYICCSNRPKQQRNYPQSPQSSDFHRGYMDNDKDNINAVNSPYYNSTNNSDDENAGLFVNPEEEVYHAKVREQMFSSNDNNSDTLGRDYDYIQDHGLNESANIQYR